MKEIGEFHIKILNLYSVEPDKDIGESIDIFISLMQIYEEKDDLSQILKYAEEILKIDPYNDVALDIKDRIESEIAQIKR